MGNISNFNVNKIDMRLSNVDYWDLYLADGDYSHTPQDTIISGDCLVAHYDFNNDDIYGGIYTGPYAPQYGYDDNHGCLIYSLTTWTGATNDGYTIPTIGLTGIDNGLVTFTKASGDTTNTTLVTTLTGTTLTIPSGDTRLALNCVTGMTGNYVYPMELIANTGSTVGQYVQLCGGFYQGYYKLDGNTYQTLPNRVPKAWAAEVWVRPKNKDILCSGKTGTILNDTYSGNSGFFLYFGTRAENKFWNVFEGVNTGSTSGCTSGATEWCTIPKETDVSFIDSSGITINLSPPPTNIELIDNQFLIYSRGTGGYTVSNWTQGASLTAITITTEVTDTRNPFLIYSRGGNTSCTSTSGDGKTVSTYSGNTKPLLELDKNADIIDNALGFRIKPDGSIGYRLLTMTATCVNEVTTTAVTMEEAYSVSGMVTDDVWNMISIRWVANETYDECELTWRNGRKGKLMFYVNAKLKFVVEDFDEMIARRLTEHRGKQVGVPFNISLGGGSQGLLESMTFDGQDLDDIHCNIRDNFAGTFIGDISQFRFYICDLNYCMITNNFAQEQIRYSL